MNNIKGTRCEKTVLRIAEELDLESGASFTCQGGIAEIQGKAMSGRKTYTLASQRSLKYKTLSENDNAGIDQTMAEYRKDTSTFPDECDPEKDGDTRTRNGAWGEGQAYGDVSVCYGETLRERPSMRKVRMLWSEWARYTLDQNITGRKYQEVTFRDRGTTDPTARLEMFWHIRYDIPIVSDGFYPGSYDYLAPPWDVVQNYGIDPGDEGVYHISHDRLTVSGGRHAIGSKTSRLNLRMPSFWCPRSPASNPKTCRFGGRP